MVSRSSYYISNCVDIFFDFLQLMFLSHQFLINKRLMFISIQQWWFHCSHITHYYSRIFRKRIQINPLFFRFCWFPSVFSHFLCLCEYSLFVFFHHWIQSICLSMKFLDKQYLWLIHSLWTDHHHCLFEIKFLSEMSYPKIIVITIFVYQRWIFSKIKNLCDF